MTEATEQAGRNSGRGRRVREVKQRALPPLPVIAISAGAMRGTW
ncbi:hypothetical protein [Actinopolyspora alba]|nr:hypothetical protein [Actinopolyspora alba]